MSTRVVYCGTEEYDIFIGKGADPHNRAERKRGDWECPFPLPDLDETPAEAAERKGPRYLAYVLARPYLVDRIRTQLRGFTLGCWCAPGTPCHGQVLADLAETTPRAHVREGCTCRPRAERLCPTCQGLYVCAVCGGAEGAITTECPGVLYDLDPVYAGRRNFIGGQWVDAVIDEEGAEGVMPCHAGRVYYGEPAAPTLHEEGSVLPAPQACDAEALVRDDAILIRRMDAVRFADKLRDLIGHFRVAGDTQLGILSTVQELHAILTAPPRPATFTVEVHVAQADQSAALRAELLTILHDNMRHGTRISL